jgi:hypothetical protein
MFVAHSRHSWGETQRTVAAKRCLVDFRNLHLACGESRYL